MERKRPRTSGRGPRCPHHCRLEDVGGNGKEPSGGPAHSPRPRQRQHDIGCIGVDDADDGQREFEINPMSSPKPFAHGRLASTSTALGLRPVDSKRSPSNLHRARPNTRAQQITSSSVHASDLSVQPPTSRAGWRYQCRRAFELHASGKGRSPARNFNGKRAPSGLSTLHNYNHQAASIATPKAGTPQAKYPPGHIGLAL